MRVRLFAQGGVCRGAYPTPTPQGYGEEAPSHSSSLHPGSLPGGQGRGARTGLLLSPGFSLLISEAGGLGQQPLSCQAQVPSS